MCHDLGRRSEEVLGRLAQKRTGTSALDGDAHFWSQLAAIVGKTPLDRKKVVKAHNHLRNQLKHNDSGDDEWVTADWQFETQHLIDRAIRNYWLAYGTRPEDRIINHYVNFYWS